MAAPDLLYLGNTKHRDYSTCLQKGNNSPRLYTTFQNEPDTLCYDSSRPGSDNRQRGSTVSTLLQPPPRLPPTSPSGAAPGRGRPGPRLCQGRAVPPRPRMRRETASAPLGDARSGAWAGSCRAPRSCGLSPAPPPASLPRRQSRAPISAGQAGQTASPCGGCFGTEGTAGSARGVRRLCPTPCPSFCPTVHPSLSGRQLVCACVTDSAERKARERSPSRRQPGAAPPAAAPSPFPRSPPRRGRPQRPRCCCSSSSLLAAPGGTEHSTL
ncbi:uncharacterized protein PRD47_007782 [Ara ararauna]